MIMMLDDDNNDDNNDDDDDGDDMMMLLMMMMMMMMMVVVVVVVVVVVIMIMCLTESHIYFSLPLNIDTYDNLLRSSTRESNTFYKHPRDHQLLNPIPSTSIIAIINS
ncbi:hypothetical protein ElyMa_005476600 [Elysia marginata]|uniref:Uncharacterized protein n=1 Tax=Elysia marginata TaxID=1093978 RepID=A0AAV4ER31_9GAST|nr:hypothetical protein ElyMa_005476600 [Elysia marginata]